MASELRVRTDEDSARRVLPLQRMRLLERSKVPRASTARSKVVPRYFIALTFL